ncbi:MAG TPA: methyltransferase [Rubrobacteraceae bacterium]|nr:methyltransferase [Rubrobacteraceae bacterium]
MDASEVSPRDSLWRMVNGYQVSQAIHVAATLGIADLLKDSPRSVDDLAEATGTHAPTLYRLLRALASVGVFVEKEGCFGLTPLAEYLRSDVPGSIRAWATFIGRPYTWSAWAHLIDSAKTGETAFPMLYGMSVWEYRTSHPEESGIFDAAMTHLSAGAAEAIADSYDFSGIGVLADVGGGQGEILAKILAANPDLLGILFDQPHVVAGAKDLLERMGVAGRCEVVGGSFFEAVPGGADAYLFKSVIHNWDDETAAGILRKCREAIPDDGRLLLVERVFGPPNEPDPMKFMDLMMLVMPGGKERTEAEFRSLLAQAEFELRNITATGSPYDIIESVPV